MLELKNFLVKKLKTFLGENVVRVLFTLFPVTVNTLNIYSKERVHAQVFGINYRALYGWLRQGSGSQGRRRRSLEDSQALLDLVKQKGGSARIFSITFYSYKIHDILSDSWASNIRKNLYYFYSISSHLNITWVVVDPNFSYKIFSLLLYNFNQSCPQSLKVKGHMKWPCPNLLAIQCIPSIHYLDVALKDKITWYWWLINDLMSNNLRQQWQPHQLYDTWVLITII